MRIKTILLPAFLIALAAYFYLMLFLTILPAGILYGKIPEIPYTKRLLQMWQHELGVIAVGGVVVGYSIHLFRRNRDWRPFAVLLIGIPLAFAVYGLFRL